MSECAEGSGFVCQICVSHISPEVTPRTRMKPKAWKGHNITIKLHLVNNTTSKHSLRECCLWTIALHKIKKTYRISPKLTHSQIFQSNFYIKGKKNRETGYKKLLVHKRYFRHTKNMPLQRLNHLLFKKRPTAKKSQQAVDLIYTLKAFLRSYPPQHLCSSQSLQEQSHFTMIFPHHLFGVVKKLSS